MQLLCPQAQDDDLINSVACWIFYVQYLFGNFYLNAFLAAIVLRSIQYLRLQCIHLGGDNEMGKKKSYLCLNQLPYHTLPFMLLDLKSRAYA